VVVFGERGLFSCFLPDGRNMLISAFVPPGNSPRFETWRVSLDGLKKKLPIPNTEQVCDCSVDDQWLAIASGRATDGAAPANFAEPSALRDASR
jgi:hypothetical protein